MSTAPELVNESIALELVVASFVNKVVVVSLELELAVVPSVTGPVDVPIVSE